MAGHSGFPAPLRGHVTLLVGWDRNCAYHSGDLSPCAYYTTSPYMYTDYSVGTFTCLRLRISAAIKSCSRSAIDFFSLVAITFRRCQVSSCTLIDFHSVFIA